MYTLKCICGMALMGFSAVVQAEGGDLSSGGGAATEVRIPSSIAVEHEDLHEQLRHLVGLGGQTGSAARDIEKLLHPHFVKEEQFALPPLRALADLAAGRMPPDAAAIARLAEQLNREMPRMLEEHKAVVAALRRLQDAAQAEGRQEGVQFAKALAAHATLEEQVLYPSALLVGRYLKEKAK